MPYGEREFEIRDVNGDAVGTLVDPGLSGLSYKELRHWRQLHRRLTYEANKKEP